MSSGTPELLFVFCTGVTCWEQNIHSHRSKTQLKYNYWRFLADKLLPVSQRPLPPPTLPAPSVTIYAQVFVHNVVLSFTLTHPLRDTEHTGFGPSWLRWYNSSTFVAHQEIEKTLYVCAAKQKGIKECDANRTAGTQEHTTDQQKKEEHAKKETESENGNKTRRQKTGRKKTAKQG